MISYITPIISIIVCLFIPRAHLVFSRLCLISNLLDEVMGVHNTSATNALSTFSHQLICLFMCFKIEMLTSYNEYNGIETISNEIISGGVITADKTIIIIKAH